MASGKRLEHVHGLRGVAALMVVFQHSFEMARMGGSDLFDVSLAHINWGRFGVVLFFLISGLVVPFSFKGERPIRSFAISRFFRLYPAYWASLAVFVVLAALQGTPYAGDLIIANLTMLQKLMIYPNIGNVYWTLLYEMIFYGACVLLCAARMLRSAHVIGTIAALLLIGAIVPSPGGAAGAVVTEFYYFSLFFIGMVLRLAFVDQQKQARAWVILLLCLGTTIGAAMGGAFFPVAENNHRFFPPIALASAMALPIPLFILALWLKPVPGKVLMYLGTISYSVYLFQQPVLDLLSRVILPAQSPVLYLLAVLATVTAIAAAVFRWVEKPMLELGKVIDRRIEGRAGLPLGSGSPG